MNVTPMIDPGAVPAPSDRRIIAVASGKGGVGKTWLAITLAQTLARQGRRTLLFDGDLGLANVDIQLGLMPDTDLQTVFTGQMALTDAILKHDETGFEIIAGRSGAGGLARLPIERLDALGERLVDLAPAYDHVLIDLGAGIETTVRRLVRPAGTILVVTNEEPTSLTDAYAFIKLTVRDQPGADIRIIVNMAPSAAAGEHAYRTLVKACENFLKFTPKLAGIVRRDPRVPDCIRHQTPLLARFPNCEAAEDVAAIVQGLTDPP
ncbi:MAG: MinD/ParA family protein [Alphaproteobacteria bacterium]|nr:MinD/ParA family protein [Alphaproteobacteria bacterium]